MLSDLLKVPPIQLLCAQSHRSKSPVLDTGNVTAVFDTSLAGLWARCAFNVVQSSTGLQPSFGSPCWTRTNIRCFKGTCPTVLDERGMVARVRVELTFAAYETAVLPLDDLAMVPPAVLEPAYRAFQTPTLPSKLKWHVRQFRFNVQTPLPNGLSIGV